MPSETMLRCVDCGAEFEFTQREQVFFQEQGWNPPRRCKTCRVKRKPASAPYTHVNGNGDKSSSEEPESVPGVSASHAQFRVNCSSCGVETSVPFKPDPKRPAFCKTCLAKSKAARK